MPRNGRIFFISVYCKGEADAKMGLDACERKWGRSQGMSLDCDASLTPSEGEREGRKELGVKASYTAVQS